MNVNRRKTSKAFSYPWLTLVEGLLRISMVKNWRKNGDYYRVLADVTSVGAN